MTLKWTSINCKYFECMLKKRDKCSTAFILLQGFEKQNSCTVRAPVFGRHQFFSTSEHYGKAHGSLLSGWMNYSYTLCCRFPTSSNILILPSQFWQIRFESCWLHCSKCRILVLLGNVQINSNCKNRQSHLAPQNHKAGHISHDETYGYDPFYFWEHFVVHSAN